MFSSLETVLLAADAADDKKAFDMQILDLRTLTYITDYFLICSCNNSSQVAAVFDWVSHMLARVGIQHSHVEGVADASWILMDYGDVVIHIFNQESRRYYSLDSLWGDAPRVPVKKRAAVLSVSP